MRNHPGMADTPRRIGVVVVAFNAADVIRDCLESLVATPDLLRIVVVDNASSDDTVAVIRAWASGSDGFVFPDDIPFHLGIAAKPLRLVEARPGAAPDLSAAVTLVHSGVNGGFAGGVNLGLAHLAAMPDVTDFWVLNPDSTAAPGTANALRTLADRTPGYGMISGRVCYMDPPGMIQIDGGTINRWTGVTGNLNLGRRLADTPAPDAAALDFVTGASMVVSRAFYDRVGPMREDYFLYYEEVDWACRGGDMPRIVCPDALVYHRAGTAIGSPTLGRFASPFSLYFKHRGQMRFMRRFFPLHLPVAYAYVLGKVAQMLLRGAPAEAMAAFRAASGLPPPARVKARLSPDAARVAFARPGPAARS